jgi:hypothetical protein
MMNALKGHLSRFNSDQRGAVALLVLAALLVIFMLALVVFDAGEAGRDKIHVQSAADAAAWSEAAVEARAMNMIAFGNVAKRVTLGMTSFYEALWLSYAQLLTLTVALAVACWVANFFAGGSLSGICTKITEFAVEIGLIMAEEAPDGGVFAADLNKGYFKDDIIALDNYQSYMAELAPWWAYAEGIQRGMRNGAAVSASFPVPPNSFTTLDVGISLPGLSLSTSGKVDSLPVERTPEGGPFLNDLCRRVYSDLDFVMHEIDYLLKSIESMTKNWKTALIYPITGAMALGNLAVTCPIQMGYYGEPARPWRVPQYPDKASWLADAANLTFAYKPDPQRMEEGRAKYGFVSRDYTHSIPMSEYVYNASGYWAMARSEVSYQNGTPDLWHPSWTARMRPVAFPGEWSGSGTKLGEAFIDVLPVMAVGLGLDALSSGDFNLGAATSDLVRSVLGTQALDNTNIEGLAK